MPKLAMSKMNLEQEPALREKFFFALALLGTLMLFSNFLWDAQAMKIKTLKQDLNGVMAQTDMLKKLIETARQQLSKPKPPPVKEAKSANDRVKKILDRRVMDATREINSVVDLLGSKTVTKKVQIADISIGAHGEEKSYTVVPITVEFTGRYAAAEAYIRWIEEQELPLIVKSFTLETSKDSPGLLRCKTLVDLYITKQ